jgi:hypothetical protein
MNKCPVRFGRQVFPMAVLSGAVPWWSLPLNWLVGKSLPGHVSGLSATSELITQPTPPVTFGNLAGSLFFAAILVKCECIAIYQATTKLVTTGLPIAESVLQFH